MNIYINENEQFFIVSDITLKFTNPDKFRLGNKMLEPDLKNIGKTTTM